MSTLSLLKIQLIFGTLIFLTSARYENYAVPRKYLRMLGGDKAEETYPFMVSLQLKKANGFQHHCGGSIINERTVITAAHCLSHHGPSDFRVHAGEKTREVIEGKVYNVEAIYCHDNYQAVTHDYDVGLVRIQGSFEFNDKIQAIVLAEPKDIIIDGSYTTILGWGVINVETQELADYLMKANVPIVKQKICNRFMGGMITDRMLCAGFQKGGIDACQMDSGGPMVYNEKLIGIVSWGLGCGKPNKPGVYVRVSELLSWVEHVMLTKYNEVLPKFPEFIELEIEHLVGYEDENDYDDVPY